MEEGLTASAAVKEAQALGIAEADPRERPRGLGRGGQGLRARQRASWARRSGRRRCGGGGSRASPGSTRGAPCARARGCGSSCAACGREGRVRVSVAPERDPLRRPALGLGTRRRARARDRPHGRDRRLRARRDRGPDGVRSALGPAPGRPGGLTRNAAPSSPRSPTLLAGARARRAPRARRSSSSPRRAWPTRSARSGRASRRAPATASC